MSGPAPRWAAWLAAITVLALGIRLWTQWTWGFGATVRDEAQYFRLAEAIVEGRGLLAPQKWLWSPGYPYLLALFDVALPWPIVRTVPTFQAGIGAASCVTVFALGRRAASARVGLVAALLYAVHPTLVYYANRFWSEGVYGPLLLAACLAVVQARDRSARWGVVPGFLLGGSILFRGVAIYMAPLFLATLLWPRPGQGWRRALAAGSDHGLAFLVALAVTVAPYSVDASVRFGGLVIADASVGQSVFLGNNDYRPITFDFGNGLYSGASRGASDRVGRPPCPDMGPVQWNRCEIRAGGRWIAAHPVEFARRIPLRVAQLFTPHTFLTRHVRWGKYVGVPWWAKELLLAGVVISSFAVLVLGTLGAVARARGPTGVLLTSLAIYTVAASAGLYGLSRFRLPIEALWLVYLAVALAEPRVTARALWRSPARLALALVLVPIVAWLTAWFLPAGYPGWHW